MEAHIARVKDLSAKVAGFYKTSTPFRLYHGNTNSTRASVRTYANSLDVSHLNHVLEVDVKRQTCVVEPNVAMDALVEATLAYGLIPPVVPEFPGITVGGAFAGTAGESSSFRYGFFDATVTWCEVILADGENVKCSQDDKPDLFNGLKGTFGTIGVGVAFEIQLMEAANYVKLSYYVVGHGITAAKTKLAELCEQPAGSVEFVDGIMFNTQQGVLLSGQLVNGNDDGLPVQTFSKRSDPWFYLHAEDLMKRSLSIDENKTEPQERHLVYCELIPLKEYYFRYDRGAFWMGRHAFVYFMTPFNRITRYLLDHFMHTRTMYHALHRSGIGPRYVIQDMAVPWQNVEDFSNWINQRLDVYPQWLCPLRADSAGGGLNPHDNGTDAAKLILNIGVWGECSGDVRVTNREIETKLRELEGLKWLYATTYYTEDEFWSMYDKVSYDKLRTKYRATTLPNVYDKVGGSGLNRSKPLSGFWKIWPLAGLYGVASTFKGGDYLRKN